MYWFALVISVGIGIYNVIVGIKHVFFFCGFAFHIIMCFFHIAYPYPIYNIHFGSIGRFVCLLRKLFNRLGLCLCLFRFIIIKEVGRVCFHFNGSFLHR